MSLILAIMVLLVSLVSLNWLLQVIIDWKSSFMELEAEKPEKANLVSVIKYNSDYYNLWIGQLFSNFGGIISMIALLLYIISIDESPMALAMYGIFQAIPMIFLSPIAGVFVDRWDRKKIMIVSDILQAITIGILPFTSTLWQIYILTLVSSSVNRFFYPARNAAIPNLVGHDELLAANSLSTLTFQIVFLIGPAFAGILIAVTGFSIAFWIDSFTFIVSAFCLYFIKTNLRPLNAINDKKKEQGHKIEAIEKSEKIDDKPSLAEKKKLSEELKSVFVDIKLGFNYVRGYGLIAFLFVLFMFYSLFAGMVGQLWPNFMKVEIGLDEIQFGLALSVFSLSGVIGAILVGYLGQKFDKLGLLIIAVMFDGIFISILGSITTIKELFIIMSIYGVISMLFEIPLVTLMQEAIRDDMRGRVNSMLNQVFSIFRVISVIIGSVLATGFEFTLFSYTIALEGTGVGGAFVYAGIGVTILGIVSLYYFFNHRSKLAIALELITEVPTYINGTIPLEEQIYSMSKEVQTPIVTPDHNRLTTFFRRK